MEVAMRRVTVTLPDDVVEEIDRWEANRSKFVLEASEREIERRRRLELRRSLNSPHVETERVAEAGLSEWGSARGPEDEDLVDATEGTPVRWTPDAGWNEVEK